MKRAFAAVIAMALVPINVSAQEAPKAAISVGLTEQEIDIQIRLNSAACKSVGLDDGGQVCDAAKFLNHKYGQARQAKSLSSSEAKK